MMYLRPTPKEDRTLSGGFIYKNIRNWIIQECMESGDPESFFDALLDVIDDLNDNRDWLEVDEDE